MSVDILAIGQNNQRKQTQNTPLPAWQQKQANQGQVVESPVQRAKNSLDRQVEIGLGSKVDDVMTKKDKQLYADGLSDTQWTLMQRYKAEGYSFEASKALVENQKKLADPFASGTNKYKDYEYKENYYNKQGITVDPDSNIYKIGSFLEKIGFNEEYGNPLNKLAQEYNEWAAKEREAIDIIQEDQEANLLEKFGWWLQRSLMTAESGIISGLAKIGNAVQGVEDIKSSAMDATLDRAILGLDTDLNYYREEDRRLDEYLWEGASGGLNTIFWAWAPKMMMAFSAIGETKVGGTALEIADGVIRGAIEWGLDNGLGFYYDGLDEQGKEDMLDTMTTLAYMEIAKRTNKWTGKLKTTKLGIEYDNIKSQFRTALNESAKGVKNQAKAEVKNVKEATNVYNEKGTKIGKMGPEGEVGVGKSVSRVINAGIDSFKQSYIDRLNARHGGKVAEPGTVETGEPATAEPTKTPESKGVVDRVKETWDTKITGLTPEERIRVQNDPYTIAKWNTAKQMLDEAGMPLEDAFITEKLYEEIGDKIIKTFQEWETKLDETSPYYNQIRQLKNKYNLIEAEQEVNNILAQNDIGLNLDGTLNFNNSKFVSEADMRSVQRAVDMINKDIMSPLTPRKYLNLRKKLDQLASYATVDASRGQSLIRQLRYALDDVAKKQIPGLKELDSVTKARFKEIQELKEGRVYKGGDRKGEIRNNFYSIIKNLTGQNRKVMLDRLEKYYPGVTDEIEAIHITEKLIKAYNKSPQIIKSLGIGGAIGAGGWVLGGAATGMVTAMLGAIIGELIQEDLIKPRTKKLRRGALEKLVNEMSPQARAKLEEIARKQLYAKELSTEETAILERVAETIIKEREKGLSEQAVREWMKRTKASDIPGLPENVQGGVVAGDKGFPTTNPTAPTYEDLGLGNIRETRAKPMLGKWKEVPLSQVDWSKAQMPSKTLYDIIEETPLEKFDGKLTAEQKQEGRELYKFASRELDGVDRETDKDIIAARGKFILMNQKPGYTKALGLDQGQVNKTITKRWEQNGGAGEKAIQFNRWINDGAKPQYRFMGLPNLITTANPWRGIDAINYLVKDVKTAEDPTKVDYKPWIDATIDSLLLMDSHFNYGEMNVRFTTQEGANQYALELAKRRATGEFVADILSLIGGQGKETIPHEAGHGADAIMGTELFGPEFIRRRGEPIYATGKVSRAYYHDNVETHDGKWRDVLDYKTPEAMEFHKQILDLMDKIEVPEWMKNDLSLDENGNPMFEYRTSPEEIWARFHQANIRLTRDISEGGRIPKKYKSDHGDTYPIELYKEWVQLLQKHQELADGNNFYKVEPINRSGISTMNGLKDYAPRQKTPEELEEKAGKMLETWGYIARGFNIPVMLEKFDPDLRSWQRKVQRKLGKDNTYSDNDFMDFFLTMKAMSKDPEFMEGLRLRAERIKKAQANGSAYGSENVTKLYDILSKGDLKLTAPKGAWDIQVINEDLLEPIRRRLIENDMQRSFNDVFSTLGSYYSPDTIQWQNNLEKEGGWHFKHLKVRELKELEGYIKDLIEKGEPINFDPEFGGVASKKYSQYTIDGEQIERLTSVVEAGIGDTFADKRIKEIANDMWKDVLDPMGDIFLDAIVGGQHIPSEELNNFYGEIYRAMGETYTTDMKEWARAVNEEAKKIGNEMGIALNRDRVVPEQKLQGLGAKLKEMLAVKGLGRFIEDDKDFAYGPLRNRWIASIVANAFMRNADRLSAATTDATKQLVALSNMSVENFEKQMKDFRGKSPMPSIAVTDVNVPHTAFGDLTLVFGRDTVDPQADPRNKIYASDAWTVTFPDIKDAGGFTFDNAKELRELIENKITTNVDSETLQEVGLDLATRESLENKIVNEILNNAYDTEYLKGWQDVGDTTVENAVDELGLDRYDNEGLYQDLQNLVADYVKQHQPIQVIPGYYFKGQVRYDDRKAIQEVVDKIWDNLPEKGIQKLKDDGWNFDESDQKYVISQKYKDTPPKEGIQRDIDDIIERIDSFPNLTPTEAGKEFVNLLREEYGFEENRAYEISESIFGDIRGDQITLQEFVDDVRGQLPDADHMGFEDRRLFEDLGGDIESILRNYGEDWAEQESVSKQAKQNMAEEIRNMYENFVDIDNRQKITGINERTADKDYDPMDEIERLGKAEELFEMTTKSMEKYPGEEVEKLIDKYADKITKKATKDRPLTAENVLEAMKNQGGPRRDVTEGSLRDLVGVEGKEFTDIEQVREKNLAKTTHDDRTGDLSAIEKRYDTIVNEIRREFTEGEPDISMEMSSQVVRTEIAEGYDPDIEIFRENLEEINPMWDMIPDDYLQAIIDCVEMGKQVPVRFSESKPERLVDLYNEVEYILVPKQDLGKVNDIVRGTPLEGKVHMYDRSGFKSERSDRIKSLQRKYGNIFFSMGGVIMPIAMLILMGDQIKES